MKVLLSPFACEPHKGSEPEVGLRTLLAAASKHDVWLITTGVAARALHPFLREHSLSARITVTPVRLGVNEHELGLASFHRYYDRWQRIMSDRARELDALIGFDVVHHATLANTWTRAGVARVHKPLVWGPVGGGVEPPARLLSLLGTRGMANAAARIVSRRLMAQLPHTRLAPSVAVVPLAQNPTTARRMRVNSSVGVLSNATTVDLSELPFDARSTRTDEILYVGRILPWKGLPLALLTLKELAHRQARLTIIGEGPDLDRVMRLARRLHVHDRVDVVGWMPRDEMLQRLRVATALLFPSLHDEAGMSVAEALSVGTPVVCLDHGGPPEVVRSWPGAAAALVRPGWPRETATAMASALDRFIDAPPPVATSPCEPSVSYAQRIDEAYLAAASRAAEVH